MVSSAVAKRDLPSRVRVIVVSESSQSLAGETVPPSIRERSWCPKQTPENFISGWCSQISRELDFVKGDCACLV